MAAIQPIFVAALAAALGAGARSEELAAPVDRHDGFTVAAPAAAGLDPAPLSGLQDSLARGDYPKTTSVLVVHAGKLVYETYAAPGGPDLLNDTRSATKSVTALAVGMVIREGAIPSARAPVFPYFTDLRPYPNDTADKRAITIEDLLTMSSALDCNDDDEKSPGNEDNMHAQPNWTTWAVSLSTAAGYSRDASGLGPWRYCTMGAFLLGQVVGRATGVPPDTYLETRLFRPLGIESSEWPYSPAHETMTGGGLRLRSRDLAKIAWMVADGGRWQGLQIVPPAWIDAMLTVHRQAYADANYGYLVWQRTYTTPCGPLAGWYMAGNGGNAILMLPERRTAIVVTRQNYNTRGMHQQTVDLLQRYILPALPCR